MVTYEQMNGRIDRQGQTRPVVNYLVTDRSGHTYNSEQELKDGIDYLLKDAEYLRTRISAYKDPAVKIRVAENARKSDEYAEHLRSLIGENR